MRDGPLGAAIQVLRVALRPKRVVYPVDLIAGTVESSKVESTCVARNDHDVSSNRLS